MRERDDLPMNRPDVLGQIAGQIHPPAIEEILRRGARRRTRRRVLMGAGVAVTVAALVATLRPLDGSGGQRPDRLPIATESVNPSPSTTSPSTTSPSATSAPTRAAASHRQQVAEELVDSALPEALVADPEDPQQRASLFTCATECNGVFSALAVSQDGFATRTVVPLAESSALVAVGGGRFVVTDNAPGAPPALVAADGTQISVTNDPVARPAGAHEVVYALPGSGVEVVGLEALDPATGVSHPVPRPDTSTADLSMFAPQRFAPRMVPFRSRATGEIGGFYGSADGGAAWTRVRLAQPGRGISDPQPSGGEVQWLPVVEAGVGSRLAGVYSNADGTWRYTDLPGGLILAAAGVIAGDFVFSASTDNGGGDRGSMGLFTVVNGAVEPWSENVPGDGQGMSLPMTAGQPVTVLDTNLVAWTSADGTTWTETPYR